jgi:hypothetical protein
MRVQEKIDSKAKGKVNKKLWESYFANEKEEIYGIGVSSGFL